MNLYQRLNEIRKTNDYIKKTKTIDGKYAVITYDDLISNVRDDFVKHGVIIYPYLVEGHVVQDTLMMTARKQPIIRYESVWSIFFVNIDDPADRLEVRVSSHGLDTGDKSTGKAVTYATKTAIVKLLSLASGEEDEARKEADATGDAMDSGAFADWSAAIGEMTGDDLASLEAAAKKLWEQIDAACKKAKDPSAATKLRAHLTAKFTALKKGLKK